MMTRAKVVVLPILLLCTLTLLVISNHARTSHAAESWSAMRVLRTIKQANNGDDRLCVSLEVAFCPRAINTVTGQRQPHAKVFCELRQKGRSEKLYAVGIFGINDPPEYVYVTGYAISELRKAKVCARDNCAMVEASYLNGFINTILK